MDEAQLLKRILLQQADTEAKCAEGSLADFRLRDDVAAARNKARRNEALSPVEQHLLNEHDQLERRVTAAAVKFAALSTDLQRVLDKQTSKEKSLQTQVANLPGFGEPLPLGSNGQPSRTLERARSMINVHYVGAQEAINILGTPDSWALLSKEDLVASVSAAVTHLQAGLATCKQQDFDIKLAAAEGWAAVDARIKPGLFDDEDTLKQFEAARKKARSIKSEEPQAKHRSQYSHARYRQGPMGFPGGDTLFPPGMAMIPGPMGMFQTGPVAQGSAFQQSAPQQFVRDGQKPVMAKVSKARPADVCHKCGKLGHWAVECPFSC